MNFSSKYNWFQFLASPQKGVGRCDILESLGGHEAPNGSQAPRGHCEPCSIGLRQSWSSAALGHCTPFRNRDDMLLPLSTFPQGNPKSKGLRLEVAVNAFWCKNCLSKSDGSIQCLVTDLSSLGKKDSRTILWLFSPAEDQAYPICSFRVCVLHIPS